MSNFSLISNANPAYIEQVYLQFQEDPESVDPIWQQFFNGYDFALDASEIPAASYSEKEVQVVKLINAYRQRGHLISNTNPIRARRVHKADLNIEYFGLSEADLETEFEVGHEIRIGKAKLKDIIAHLQETYCGSVGAEFRYIPDSRIRMWLHEEMESIANKPAYTKQQKVQILKKLVESVDFEKFLHVKYVGQKRFSMEGIEAAIPAIDVLFQEGSELGVKEFVMGMPHRGRLNVLTNLFKKPPTSIFTEFEGGYLPDDVLGDGDVKYHMGHSADVTTDKGKHLHLSLSANPSHLEAVNPVVLGNVKAKEETFFENDTKAIVPILVHGDAAIAGQGVVYECANFSQLDGYSNGGIIHVVFNNQVGFTANYRESRSSLYCTDIAKVMDSPVFHVNADDPEAVVHVAQMAIKLRQKFGIDVYIDILGYRRYGHNEGDEPRFTQPLLYNAIKKHETVLDIYVQKLIGEGVVTQVEVDQIRKDYNEHLQECLNDARESNPELSINSLSRQWSGYVNATQNDFEFSPNTGVKRLTLDNIANSITTTPANFNILPKMRKIIDQRRNLYFEENTVDWGAAEALAFGSLLIEGHPVRVSGQDSRRGTFAHRHSVLKDASDESDYIMLNHLSPEQATYTAYNSHLSEYAVLGFEYGYSSASPNGLTIWEAQFGDFANGAQVMIDQFISSSQSKWQRLSGVVMLLPHGYEGQGPEHSSARLERFLSLAAENNMTVANVTTPANFFHLLRRQMKVKYRIPLIVMSPKSLLRHPRVRSDIKELTDNSFQETIDDPAVKTKSAAKKIERLLLCSGKIYYELLDKKEKEGFDNVAIVRIEQFYPTPKEQDTAMYEKYKTADWMWVQEEPQNMGGWYYMRARLDHLKSDIRFASRKKSASPAHGNYKVEARYQQKVLDRAFEGLTPKKN